MEVYHKSKPKVSRSNRNPPPSPRQKVIISTKEEALAEKWIEEMREWNLSTEQMQNVIQLAKAKHKLLKE
ncbi:hypothetical protein [Tenacibaculum sp. nBUS_03]|uniref:hypothetical protein n=1 Tax=Tenacibaculum sp. nBUS_03 TaxID=3395320 RepID=UPI003EB7CE9E